MTSTFRIRALNDRFRVTHGVRANGPAFMMAAVEAVRAFDDFGPDNDPHGEQDFGSLTVEGRKLFWKIDYYAASMEAGSEDPADPDQTVRVLTIMLSREW